MRHTYLHRFLPDSVTHMKETASNFYCLFCCQLFNSEMQAGMRLNLTCVNLICIMSHKHTSNQ